MASGLKIFSNNHPLRIQGATSWPRFTCKMVIHNARHAHTRTHSHTSTNSPLLSLGKCTWPTNGLRAGV